MVQQAIEDLERRCAEKLAVCERRVGESEARLNELESYQYKYFREFASRTRYGIGVAGLRDYQAFLTRLAEAVRQQTHKVLLRRAERDAERQSWQNAAQRAQTVRRIVQRWRTEERRELNEDALTPILDGFHDGRRIA